MADATRPGFYLFDAGVFRALRPAGPLDRPEEMAGAALEGLVWQRLRSWSGSGPVASKRTLAFWRTRSGVEVEFVVNPNKKLVAIEVKNARQVRESDHSSLVWFRSDCPTASAVLLYRGTEQIRGRDVPCMNVAEFLRGLQPRLSMRDVLARYRSSRFVMRPAVSVGIEDTSSSQMESSPVETG